MMSTPKMEYQVFLSIFQKYSAMANLGLKEMVKFLWEGREKGLPCWLSQFSKTKLFLIITFHFGILECIKSKNYPSKSVSTYLCQRTYINIHSLCKWYWSLHYWSDSIIVWYLVMHWL